jgi:hypothetical protein
MMKNKCFSEDLLLSQNLIQTYQTLDLQNHE